MPVIAIQDFASMMPLRDPILLPENNAQYAENTWLYKGGIRGFRKAASVHTNSYADTKQNFRIPSTPANPPDFVGSTWLELPDTFMSVIRNPVVGDTYNRYYFFPSDQYNRSVNPEWPATNPGPVYNTLARLQAGSPFYTLGVPAPGNTGNGYLPPGVTPPSGTTEVRSYVYTYLTTFKEEGPPSGVTTATGTAVGTWAITIPAPSPDPSPGRTMGGVRLYRTVTDSNGNASYYLVHEFTTWGPFPINFNDTLTGAQIVNNLPLSTNLYTPPPADLQGVVMMANGIMVGWSNQRELWFSAAFLPHAWPPNYALTVDYPIVGLAANGTSLNVLTEGPPYIATGVTPDTMTIGIIKANEPCVGRGSIVSSGEGAYYASPNGIILLNPGGTTSVSQFIMEKEFFWSLQPWTWTSGKYGMTYVAFARGSGIPNVDPDGDLLSGIVIDHTDKNVPFSFLKFSSTSPVLNMMTDEYSGQLFAILTDKSVMQWHPPAANPPTTSLLKWEWRSKKFRAAFKQTMKCFECQFTVPSEVTITLGARNIDPNMVFNMANQYLIVTIWADGHKIITREVQVSGEVLLIPGGFKALIWEIWFEGQIDLTFFKMAGSVKELKGK